MALAKRGSPTVRGYQAPTERRVDACEMHSTVVRAISVRPAARIAAARAKPSARPCSTSVSARGEEQYDVFLQKGTHRSRLVASRAEKQSDGAGEADAEKPKKASEDVAKDETTR